MTKQRLAHERIHPEHPQFNQLPLTLKNNMYHSVTPLPSDGGPIDSLVPTVTYKCFRASDGACLAVRRTMNARVPEELALHALKPWLNLHLDPLTGAPQTHPGIVPVCDAFVSTEFGDVQGAICFVSNFIPGAVSVQTAFLSNAGPPLSESQIWSFLAQLLGALSKVHSHNLACRGVIHPTKVLVVGDRLRLNCCGLLDALQMPHTKSLQALQYDDVLGCGQLVLCLCLQTTNAAADVSRALNFVGDHFSTELKTFLGRMVLRSNQPPTSHELVQAMSAQLLNEFTRAQMHADRLEDELSKELHNGRLFRLVCKVGCARSMTFFVH
jgi:PAB-dependent poly(A)-specific ribonuclease subunit 3